MSATVTDALDEIREHFRTDLTAFAEEGPLLIETKKAELVPLGLNRAQRVMHQALARQRRDTGRVRAIVLKARQLGASTYVAARNFRAITLNPNLKALVIADEKKRASVLFGIYRRFYDNLADWARPPTMSYRQQQVLAYRPPLSSRVEVETAGDRAAGRATTTQYAHLSEFAFWPEAETVMAGLMQAVPHDASEVVIESTANGVGGMFHRMWREAVAGSNGWLPIFLAWFLDETYAIEPTFAERVAIENDPDPFERRAMTEGLMFGRTREVLTVEQLCWRRRTIRDACDGDVELFKQEYPSNPTEAFLASGSPFFDTAKLRAYDEVAIEPTRGNITRKASVGFVPEARGYLRLWEGPKRESAYAIFADTASGRKVGARRDSGSERGGTDFCSAHVFDVVTRAFVACLHGRIDPEVYAEMLYDLGHWYTSPRADSMTSRSAALLAVENVHTSGQTVLSILQRMAYPNLFYHRLVNRRENKPTKVLGWVTNAETRPLMLDGLAIGLREESFSLWDAETVAECFTFARDDTGKPVANEGCHDDRVISAAGALAIARFVHVPRPPVMQRPELVGSSPTGDFEW